MRGKYVWALKHKLISFLTLCIAAFNLNKQLNCVASMRACPTMPTAQKNFKNENMTIQTSSIMIS